MREERIKERTAEAIVLIERQMFEIHRIVMDNQGEFFGKLKSTCSETEEIYRPTREQWTIGLMERTKERAEEHVTCLRNYARKNAPSFVEENNFFAKQYSAASQRWWSMSGSTMPPRALVSELSVDFVRQRVEDTLVRETLSEYNRIYSENIETAKYNTREIEKEALRRENLARSLARLTAQNQRMLDQQLSQLIYGVRPSSSSTLQPVIRSGFVSTTSSVANGSSSNTTQKKQYRWASCDRTEGNLNSRLHCIMKPSHKIEPNTVYLHRCDVELEGHCHRGVFGGMTKDLPDDLNDVLPPLR
ncbi:hypothetical protein NBRC116590_32090 [Pelagimonas sp. KU-00592-HH]